MANKILNKQLLKMGADQIWEERQEQFHKHGRTIEGDIENNLNGELLDAVLAILLASRGGFANMVEQIYPHRWGWQFLEHCVNKPYNEKLAVLGALIAAEIDRDQFKDEYYDNQASGKIKVTLNEVKPYSPDEEDAPTPVKATKFTQTGNGTTGEIHMYGKWSYDMPYPTDPPEELPI